MRNIFVLSAFFLVVALSAVNANAGSTDWKREFSKNGGSGNTVTRVGRSHTAKANVPAGYKWGNHPSNQGGRNAVAGRNMSSMGMGARAGRAPGGARTGANTKPAAMEVQ